MKPLGQRIRAFFEQLLISRHVRFLEAELVRVRLEKDALIRNLQEEKRVFMAKIDKLEQAMWPKAFAERKASPVQTVEIESEPRSFVEALEQHKRKLEEESKDDKVQ